jgi:hypothetical protein
VARHIGLNVMSEEDKSNGILWYLKQGIKKIEAYDQTQWRTFTKWYFDLLKNLLVVSGDMCVGKQDQEHIADHTCYLFGDCDLTLLLHLFLWMAG